MTPTGPMIQQPTQREENGRQITITIRFPQGVCPPTSDELRLLAAWLKHRSAVRAKQQVKMDERTILRVVERFGAYFASAIDPSI